MNLLAETAFGAEPGCWPLPHAQTPEEHWWRAVAAGGQGRYAAALAELDVLGRLPHDGPHQSLALSTRASFLRQLGWHARARRWDGYAVAGAGADEEAGADALIGLAADALGTGRLAASARLLIDATRAVDGLASTRLPQRLAWVSAELAMASGDGQAAVGHAERAVALAATSKSVRHAVKSDVVLAAAWCCAGEPTRSRAVADAALVVTEQHGLIPLTWALACLLADVGSAAREPADVLAIRAESAAAVEARGGVWSNR